MNYSFKPGNLAAIESYYPVKGNTMQSHPGRDNSSFFTLTCLTVLTLWLWFMSGCTVAMTTAAFDKVPEAPQFETVHNPIPSECGGLMGYINREHTGYTYAWITADATVVWYLIYLTDGEKITEAWVDVDFDGTYDLYFASQEELFRKYEGPCSPIPSGPMSRA